jgi:hypothetical protein
VRARAPARLGFATAAAASLPAGVVCGSVWRRLHGRLYRHYRLSRLHRLDRSRSGRQPSPSPDARPTACSQRQAIDLAHEFVQPLRQGRHIQQRGRLDTFDIAGYGALHRIQAWVALHARYAGRQPASAEIRGKHAAGQLGLLLGQAQRRFQVLHQAVVTGTRETEHQFIELAALQADFRQAAPRPRSGEPAEFASGCRPGQPATGLLPPGCRRRWCAAPPPAWRARVPATRKRTQYQRQQVAANKRQPEPASARLPSQAPTPGVEALGAGFARRSPELGRSSAPEAEVESVDLRSHNDSRPRSDIGQGRADDIYISDAQRPRRLGNARVSSQCPAQPTRVLRAVAGASKDRPSELLKSQMPVPAAQTGLLHLPCRPVTAGGGMAHVGHTELHLSAPTPRHWAASHSRPRPGPGSASGSASGICISACACTRARTCLSTFVRAGNRMGECLPWSHHELPTPGKSGTVHGKADMLGCAATRSVNRAPPPARAPPSRTAPRPGWRVDLRGSDTCLCPAGRALCLALDDQQRAAGQAAAPSQRPERSAARPAGSRTSPHQNADQQCLAFAPGAASPQGGQASLCRASGRANAGQPASRSCRTQTDASGSGRVTTTVGLAMPLCDGPGPIAGPLQGQSGLGDRARGV